MGMAMSGMTKTKVPLPRDDQWCLILPCNPLVLMIDTSLSRSFYGTLPTLPLTTLAFTNPSSGP